MDLHPRDLEHSDAGAIWRKIPRVGSLRPDFGLRFATETRLGRCLKNAPTDLSFSIVDWFLGFVGLSLLAERLACCEGLFTPASFPLPHFGYVGLSGKKRADSPRVCRNRLRIVEICAVCPAKCTAW